MNGSYIISERVVRENDNVLAALMVSACKYYM